MQETDIIFAERSNSALQQKTVVFAREVRSHAMELLKCSWADRKSIDQFYRSGVSVGANVREAIYAESPKDFVHKLKIAEKELGEFFYWLGLLSSEPSIIGAQVGDNLCAQSQEIGKLLASSIITMKRKHSL
ncbi:MAG: four helix bundle protein [Ignavibacteria bacterium]|nr:four helix bundle protein [Ignavibacteria bacterium]